MDFEEYELNIMESEIGKLEVDDDVELQTFIDENGEEIKYAYIVQLEGDESTLEIPNEGQISLDVDVDNKEVKSEEETISLTYYPSAPNQNICLDDEQASAVANLLEFHNQQTKFQQVEVKDDIPNVGQPSSSRLIAPKNPVPLVPMNTIVAKVMPQVGQILAPALKTYSTKPIVSPSKVSKPVQPIQPTNIPQSQVLKVRKKRRLLIDTVKVIPNAEFKEQLANTTDIVGKLDIAPTTKKAMHFLTYGGVGKFFAYPGRKILSVPLAKLFFSHLTMTTEVRNTYTNTKLEDLDPDLKTPESVMAIDVVKQDSQANMYNRIYNDSIARRTANSFDQFIKGMSVNKPRSAKGKKTAKYKDYRRRGETVVKTDKKPSPVETTKIEPKSPLKDPSMTQETLSRIVKRETETLMEYETANGEAQSYTMADANGRMIDLDGSGSMYLYQGQLPDQEPGQEVIQSNIELLLAAAQQQTTELTAISLANELKEGKGEVNGGTKDEILFCSAESTEEGNLIIVDSNGERYTVFTNNGTGITLLPEPQVE